MVTELSHRKQVNNLLHCAQQLHCKACHLCGMSWPLAQPQSHSGEELGTHKLVF
jgi:hypothetical protein